MKLSLSQNHVQTHELSQRQMRKLDQKISQRLAMLQVLYEDEYLVEGECPDCRYKNTSAEVLVGFLEDVDDFTTECKKCGCRFEPRLTMKDRYGKTTIPFFCQEQALHKLKSMEVLEPEKFIANTKDAGVYRSLMVHFGSLKLAYKEIGVNYPYSEIEEWKIKVRPFLGKISDTEIAEICDVKVGEVKKLRESFGISKKSFFIQ